MDMGFFSWLTADTEESVANIYSGKFKGDVYLLQPHGKPPIKEEAYEGYGDFDGVDAYAWLCEANAEHLGIDIAGLTHEEKRNVGIGLAVGQVLIDANSGDVWHVFHDQSNIVDGSFFEGTYSDVIPQLGDSMSNLLESGAFKRKDISEIVEIRYPIKLSFSSKVVYEDLGPSKDCPDQGYFYSYDEDEEDEEEYVED